MVSTLQVQVTAFTEKFYNPNVHINMIKNNRDEELIFKMNILLTNELL